MEAAFGFLQANPYILLFLIVGMAVGVSPARYRHHRLTIGYHVFKINAAVLMGGVAGERSHSGPRVRRRPKSAAPFNGSASPWGTPCPESC